MSAQVREAITGPIKQNTNIRKNSKNLGVVKSTLWYIQIRMKALKTPRNLKDHRKTMKVNNDKMISMV